MKRGVTSQFTWIFILIAGAIILTFFITIGTRIQVQSQQKLSIELEQSLDSIIGAALQSPGTSLEVPTPRAGIAFQCTRTCDCSLRVGSRGTEFGEKIYFAPPRIEDTEMVLWTRYWNTPFRTTNFLYVIDPTTTYYIVTSTSTESQSVKDTVIEQMPIQANIQFVDESAVSSITNEGPARFIFLRSNKGALHPSFSDDVLHAVQISGDTVQFLLKDEDLLTFELVGESLPILNDDVTQILAAAFSSDRNMYACGMRHAYQKLHFIADIFSKRSTLLDGHEDRCFYTGPAAETPLNDISTAAEQLALDPTLSSAISIINEQALSIEKRNTEKITDGCPALY